jgi:hypothetical protein
VILCRKGKAEAPLQRLREIMGKLKLTVSEEKTRICKVPEGAFDFLGYTFGRMFSARTGQARIGSLRRPSHELVVEVRPAKRGDRWATLTSQILQQRSSICRHSQSCQRSVANPSLRRAPFGTG